MAEPIEFFFDFASGYSFFAALEIEDLAMRHGRAVRWQAYSLGTPFKQTRSQPLTRIPLKAEYTAIDWSRIAAMKGIDGFAIPDGHPHAGLPALRSFHWIDQRDPAKAAGFARAIFVAYFTDGLAIDDVAAVAEAARPFGVDPTEIALGIADPELKARVREVGEKAVARGVFGAPWFIVDGEPFWGWDRLPMIERRLGGG